MKILLASCCILILNIVIKVECTEDTKCNNKTCPSQLECRYPKITVELPDPNNECCNITECICEGTTMRLSASHNRATQFTSLINHYTNCTWVDGNLEITHIEQYSQVLDAVKHIRVVTGYVLIAMNNIHYINLSSLRLIRGDNQFYEERTKSQSCGYSQIDTSRGYSLLISNNYQKESVDSGVKEIWMPLLTEIMQGDVKIYDNRDLCYLDTIVWKEEIFNSNAQKANVSISSLTCLNCSTICRDGFEHCWGNSSGLCQQFTRIPCKGTCTDRCNSKKQCCDSYCAAGCTIGDLSKGIVRTCHVCKELNNFGKCVQKCPTGAVGSNVPKIDEAKVRYQLTWYCVPKCPGTRRLYENSLCVLTCPETFYEENGVCKKCSPDGCNHICYGLESGIGPLQKDDVIHSNNIGNFTKNCTIIEGSLIFRQSTFDGDTHCDIQPIHNRAHLSVFENVEEITGYLDIEYWPYEDLCIFKNLKTIRGYNVRSMTYSLLVITDGKDLRELCFNSLKEIQAGQILIFYNRNLCFMDTVNWQSFYGLPYQITQMGKNARPNKCVPCHDQCNSQNGCWGPNNDQCVTCKNYTDYTNSLGLFTDAWVIDEESGKYMPGHNITTCVGECDFDKGVYLTEDGKCFPCNTQCNSTCSGKGPGNCTSSRISDHGCKHVHYEGICVPECPKTHYPNASNFCLPCSSGCIDGGCTGPEDSYGNDGCSICYMMYDEEENQKIYRGAQCQVCLEHLKDSECALGCIHDKTSNTYQCYEVPSSTYIIWIVVVCVILVLAFSILIILYKCRRTVRSMRRHIGEKIVGDGAQADEFDTPVTPSGTAPNRAQLRIVKENELAMGKTLGSGAFGAVYKAVWTSMHIEGQQIKIPVAVKKLKTFSHSNEIMDEAYVMASVDSPYLVRLLGICMTEQVSLITQLIPLGSLLEYVRDNSETIGSRHMLTWCTQIAKGMQYLQDKHLVHRDLAARNVLVKTPHHVKITDFGLAKMLSADQSVYFAEGGKLPIKWLAIECITERQFSHQSDVWAYGVTCWEIFTFGARPYEGVHATDVLSLLERGERLNQPPICTIDVYMILIKCWMVDPLSRPKFAELVEDFTNMCKDHMRYIVIKDDPNTGIFSPNPEDEKRFFEQLMKEDNANEDQDLLVDEPDNYLLSRNTFFEPEYENQPTISEPLTESPTANVGAASTHPANAGIGWPPTGRKDSEENPRYTEDPTLHRSSYFDQSRLSDIEGKMLYDEDQYLLPSPGKHKPDYFDPVKSNIPKQVGAFQTPEQNTEFESSLSNNTYVKTERPHASHTHASHWSPDHTSQDHLISLAPEYVNTQDKDVRYLRHNSEEDSSVPDILLEPNDFRTQGSGNTLRNGTKNFSKGTFFNNEEYMTTDSETMCGENGLHVNGVNRMTSCQHQNSSGLSQGSGSDNSLGPLVSQSPEHLTGEGHQVDMKKSTVHYKPASKAQRDTKTSTSSSICLENPEYMMLQDSVTVSDSSKLLPDGCNA